MVITIGKEGGGYTGEGIRGTTGGGRRSDLVVNHTIQYTDNVL